MAQPRRSPLRRSESDIERQLESLAIPFMEQFNELFDPDDIIAAGRRLGVIQRQRKLDLPALVEATILTLSGPDGPQTTIMGNYFTLSGERVAPSSFYGWFDAEYAELLQELATRAVAAVREVEDKRDRVSPDGSLLQRLGDIRLADATCVILRKLAQPWAPSTSKNRPAGMKLHTVMTFGNRMPAGYHVSPQRDHDSAQLDEATFEPGTLAIYDLAYVNHGREVRLIQRGVHVLRRLKGSESPRILKLVRGHGDRKACRGKRLDQALDAGLLHLGEIIDLDAELRAKDDAVAAVRIIGIEGPDGETRWYLTSLPRERLSAEDIVDAYALRWEIELLFKAFKTGVGLDKILAWRKEAVLALVHAKVIALALARLLKLSADDIAGDHALTQLAIVLTLSRMTPLIMAMRLRRRAVDLAEMERRLLLITLELGRSRRRRRERTKREKLERKRDRRA